MVKAAKEGLASCLPYKRKRPLSARERALLSGLRELRELVCARDLLTGFDRRV